MPCPFPGMDPYVERPEIFPDFHDRLVTFLCGALQPLLRPRYVALMQDRLYVVRDEQVRKPDVAVIRALDHEPKRGGAALLEVDTPAIFESYREEFREPLIEIVEPAAGNRVVTAIEVLSPSNKQPGPGRTSYLAKRDQYLVNGVNIVEIDLLRHGQPTVALNPHQLDSLQPWRYLVAVSRCPTPHEIYAFPLERRLPKIAVPLDYGDRDVPLDLQAAFQRTWDEGPYPELLHYDRPAPAELSPSEQLWCREQLTKAGFALPAA
jgi:hypothetical protein